jgi:signal transduction histidine kinase
MTQTDKDHIFYVDDERSNLDGIRFDLRKDYHIHILGNLIDNAIKFTDKGKMEIGYSLIGNACAGNICFYVKDSGIGIPEKKFSEIVDKSVLI